ncbi:hypothetical protein GRX03_07250 [Halovenus sp. WSH3]|uniref:Uncharacterized protein n=1 Tax=Halovenus carboxidivorans TaxID=2692199 RepID=A0A6B0SZU4_9EURY|nr:hypothetical protein [Halovenus carboxidivorans]MXR51398.1 hypothetical protein [Halovenus carboxidivorans]
MLRRGAGRIAAVDAMPTAVRAVFGYYADTGAFDAGSLGLKRRVDARVEEMIETAFAEVEAAIAEEFGYDFVQFSYDTKLVLPAKLTLGYLYRRLDDAQHREAEAVTRLAVEALIDGDMRDALNDAEYGDFGVDFPTAEADRERIAEIAQSVLQRRVDEQFESYPDELREYYDWAVEISEAHQEEDEEFRNLMSRARAGEEAAREAIRDRYKYGTFEEDPTVFSAEELELPYLKTQYDRVGVIYDGMIEMYRAAGFDIEPAFKRSIVLAIIGAQIWLDDLDDYEVDLADGQLTPVTAEYLLADSGPEAKAAVIEISESYLNRARQQATAVDSTLTGIATEYIHRDGDPSVLPRRLPE